jgi:DNA modification methylase
MKPYYSHAGVTIYHGDCREVLPSLGQVDAVVADPPFGIGFKYESHDDTPEGYGAFVWGVTEACERLCAPASPVFVWQSMLNARHFAEWFPRDWRIFAAAKNFVQLRKVAMQHSWDPVLVWWTPGDEPYHLGRGAASVVGVNRDFHIANSSAIVSDTTAPQRQHPCPRPLDQVKFIVSQWVRPGGIVLDPFCGSGTSVVAARELGRCAIGIEIEERYCEIAARRLSQEVMCFGGAA